MTKWQYAQVTMTSPSDDNATVAFDIQMGGGSASEEAENVLTGVPNGLAALNALGGLGWELQTATAHPMSDGLVEVFWMKRPRG